MMINSVQTNTSIRFIMTVLLSALIVIVSAMPGEARLGKNKRLLKKSESRNAIIDVKGSSLAKYPFGSIVVDTSERRLYYMLKDGKAIRYRVAVGKPKMQWFGNTFVTLKRKNPGWTPTARMRRAGAPKYVPPGPKNPLGVRAIYLGWSEYRIHGTISPRSIGRAASSGCIRMLNRDVIDLFKRVHIGAPVHVIR